MNNQDTRIKQLENLVLSDELEELNSLTNDFNIFTALKLHNNEIRHSNFLGWLMSPYENHGLGDYFLKEFLKQALIEFSQEEGVSASLDDVVFNNFDDAEIRREYKSIDLLIISPSNKFFCVVENKIWSEEHSQQLERYKKIAEDEFPDYEKRMFIFLTPHKDYGQNKLYKHYIPMNYEQVLTAIEKTLRFKSKHLTQAVYFFIENYKKMIERNIMSKTDEKVLNLCRKIYREHKEAIDLICENTKVSRQEEIASIIDEILSEENSFIVDSTNNSFIRFMPKSLNLKELKIAEEWTDSKQLVLAEFENTKSSLWLSLVVGPVDEKNKAYKTEICELLKNNMVNVCNYRPNSKYTHVASLALIRDNDYHSIVDFDREELKKHIKDATRGFFEKLKNLEIKPSKVLI
ncbi:MAG: PD-(D/E)XK nuclease family protein [Candidatus Gastranaerophilales bacterium]|nr:PD-(D/E)XK nuclease family protein [Candidatus Gastranaerophilales bacterium]